MEDHSIKYKNELSAQAEATRAWGSVTSVGTAISTLGAGVAGVFGARATNSSSWKGFGIGAIIGSLASAASNIYSCYNPPKPDKDAVLGFVEGYSEEPAKDIKEILEHFGEDNLQKHSERICTEREKRSQEIKR